MELATESTLRSEIASGAVKQRSLSDRMADARAIAAGLAAIHAAGIIHRDISPQNVLRMADGRLVVSDFGLAIDPSETTTSVRGGTVAYMAPEVVGGGSSSFASDVWSLGAVIYEAVFGERPRWRNSTRSEIVDPALGRRLEDQERVALDACRVCMARNQEKRPRRTADVVKGLGDAPKGWRHFGLRRRATIGAAVVAAIAIISGTGFVTMRRMQTRSPSDENRSSAVPTIALTGEAEDWTESSDVLARIPSRLECAVLLPDHRSIRYVWGQPPRAEDLDTRSGQRTPSAVVPAAYAEGCPDLSPNGRRLVFQGRTPEGRPSAFVSEYPDGRNAVPVVPTGDPSVDSQPLWMPDSESFAFDVDVRHVGIFSTTLNRTAIVPEPALPSYLSAWRWIGRDLVVVAAHNTKPEMEVTGYGWPSLNRSFRFRLDLFAINFVPVGHGKMLFTAFVDGTANIAEVDYVRRSARRLGYVRGQYVKRPFLVENGVVFLSVLDARRLEVRGKDGRFRTLLEKPALLTGIRCGHGYLTHETTDSGVVIVHRDVDGRETERKPVPSFADPTCAADGHVWYYASQAPEPGIVQCEGSICSRIVDGDFVSVAASPSGKRLAVVRARNRGFELAWLWAEDRVVRELAMITEALCTPTWSGENTLWVVRQHQNRHLWFELNVDSGVETGRSVPAAGNCSDGSPEGRVPFEGDTRVTSTRVSEWRHLRRPPP
jgi:serine/threonine protein kinase